MKKILILAMMAALVITAAASAEDYDFSGKTTAELVEIQKKVNEALWASDGWNEVTVPAGMYEVGKDIPAGDWLVDRTTSRKFYLNTYQGRDGSELKGLLDMYWMDGDSAVKLSLVDGMYLEFSGPLVFKTFTPAFTFK